MIKLLRFLVIISVLSFVFINVYVATLPSVNKYSFKRSCDDVTISSVKKQIISFQNWKKNKEAAAVKLYAAETADVLLNRLKVVLPDGESFTVENQIITDTIIVQHIYGLEGSRASVLKWSLGKKECLGLEVEELLGNKQKLLTRFGVKHSKSDYLKKVSKHLMNFDSNLKLSSLEELKSIKPKEKKIKLDTIIRLPKQ